MQIEKIPVEKLHAAEYNPRRALKPGDAEYEKLKHSITEFGYVEPVIWNKQTGNVVGGHQRLKILQEQGIKEAECVIVEFDESKEKALNIALNKITNKWDLDKLSDLLEDIKVSGLDLDITGFNADDIIKLNKRNEFDFDRYYGDAREVTFNYYRLHEYDEERTAGYYNFPTIKACHVIPEKLIGFNYVKSWNKERKGLGVHFFLDDYQFERMWSNPFENIERLRGFSCVFSPQFSSYRDMPMAMKIYQMYRSSLIGQVMQDAGLEVIPSLQWVEPETYKFCFDGLEPGGVVAVGTMGIARDKIARELWYSGMTEAIKRLNPECVLYYGPEIGYDFGNVRVKKFSATGGFYNK